MFNFQQSVLNYHTENFQPMLKRQLKSLPSGSLPLQKGLTQGGYVDDNDIDAIVLNDSEADEVITIKLGIFFTEIVINCGCGDDPMPLNAYCEMRMVINKQTASAIFDVI